MEKLLQNKYVLYLVLFIAISNILGYLAIEDFNSLMVFIAICALASYFSKNMIIILGSAILGTNILYANSRMREGFDTKEIKKKAEEAKSEIEEKSSKKSHDKKKKDKKKQDGFKGGFSSSQPPRAATEEEEDEVDSTRIDYAATMEQAYDNLNKMLGDGGMKNLTKDTKGLMDQQKELMGQLKDFAPLMEQAGSMLDKLGGMDNLKGLMGKMGGIKLPNGKKK
ncbi:MAG: hypothetical protein H8E55_50635 [Pelagibacterales bacterium]|jgi:uncharacterized membrane protein (DUF106 family)|nr:hypothetical protein [Pelagibacterales bacterium]